MADYKKIMLEAFKQKANPTMFLAGMARPKITKAVDIEIDVVRGRRTHAVAIKMGTGSRMNDLSQFTTKTYQPVFYDEAYSITAMELQKRLPGMTVYQAESSSYAEDLAALITDKQSLVQDKEVRAIELQASTAMFDGKITNLPGGLEVDFQKKATHDIQPTNKWSASNGVPLTNIQAGCDLCRKDGMVEDMVFELVVADDVIEALLGNAQFVSKANLRHVTNVNIGMPMQRAGGVFHGVFSAGPYTIELWSYPQVYEVPTGFGLSGEGTLKPYIPSAKALLKPKSGIRFDLVYGGIPQVVPQVDPILSGFGLNGSLTIVEGDFVPYAYVDWRKQCIEAGVRTNPLFIPHQIDGFVTFKVLV